VADSWLAAMQDVLKVASQSDIPELNEYQCGTFEMHSLEQAKEIARNIIAAGINVNRNDDLSLSEAILKGL
ncbi:S-ribosylhomocysteine lyase, partial [Shewanella sp. 0m-11]